MRVKICGIKTVEDAHAAVAAGADALGLNFYPGSKRYIEADTARAIVRALPPFVEPVGLFVNEPREAIVSRLATLGGLRTVQWHGPAPEVGGQDGIRWIVAFAVASAEDIRSVAEYVAEASVRGAPPAAVLVDAHVPGAYGGTGQRAPWHLLEQLKPGVPVILAGGLTAENVAEAIRVVRPYAVDVASGVERSPGQKDAELMRRFIGTAREAFARL